MKNPRRYRVRRVLKWAGVLAFVFALATCGLSLMVDLGIPLVGVSAGTYIRLQGGCLHYERMEFTSDSQDPVIVAWYPIFFSHNFPKRIEWWPERLGQRSWLPIYAVEASANLPSSHYLIPYRRTTAELPLWIPVFLIAIPMGFGVLFHRKRFPAGHCKKCGYNLTGNVSGVCPKCGTRVPAI